MSLARQFVDAGQPVQPIVRPRVTPALVARVTESPTVTQTLPVTVTKKIGRPKSDHAMTPVERQRRRRDRLALAKADA